MVFVIAVPETLTGAAAYLSDIGRSSISEAPRIAATTVLVDEVSMETALTIDGGSGRHSDAVSCDAPLRKWYSEAAVTGPTISSFGRGRCRICRIAAR